MSVPVRAADLTKTYRDGLRRVEVLRGIDLAVEPGDILEITSGSRTYTVTIPTGVTDVNIALFNAEDVNVADNGTSKTKAAKQSSRTHPRPAREALASDVAAKVKAAALEKVPGATVLRTVLGTTVIGFLIYLVVNDLVELLG